MFLSRNYEYKELYSDDRFVIYERDVVQGGYMEENQESKTLTQKVREREEQ